jgi:oligopeptide transport system substrate-binding protein
MKPSLACRIVPFGLSLLFLTACAKRETPVQAGIRTQTLLVGNHDEPADLDPHVALAVGEGNIMLTLFEGLTAEGDAGEAVPAAAERWDMSADGLTYTFHLRPHLRWSNGDPVVADDFVSSFQRMLSPKMGAEYSYMLWPIKGAKRFNKGILTDFSQVGVNAPDRQTLRLTLEHPTPYLPLLAAHFTWLPVHGPTLAKFSAQVQRGTRWTRAGNLVGNGPFTLTEWTPNARVVVTKNPHYWDTAHVRLNRVVFYPIESSTTEENNFRAGQLHVTWDLPMAKVPAYRAKSPTPMGLCRMIGTDFLRFNVAHAPLGDPRVRRALGLAIDRETMARVVTHGTRPAALALTPPQCGGYTPRARVDYDPAAAQRLLAEAGYPNGKGWPSISLQTFSGEINRTRLEALQAMWRRELGIQVTVDSFDLKTLLQNLQAKRYGIGLAGWIADFPDPASFLELFVTDGGNNWTGWSNARYDALIARAKHTADPAARFEVFQQAEALLLEEAPITPLDHLTRAYLVHSSVKGWAPSVLGYYRYKSVSLEP